MPHYVGVDWASAEHAVCVIDQQGSVCLEATIAHSAAGFDELRDLLRRLDKDPSRLPIAIERPSGLLVDWLVEAGFRVVPIHPNAVKAARARYSAAQSKSDRFDAYLLADLLRTDGHRFRPLLPLSDETRALRALVRTRDELVRQRVALTNQLGALLESFWPGAAEVFARIDSPIALAFLARYPTPQSAERLGEKRLGAFLRSHVYRGHRTAADLLLRLRAAAPGCVGAREAETRGALVLALIAVLEPLVKQIRHLTAAIDRALQQHVDGPVFMSFPRAGRVNAAQLLVEVGDERARFHDPDQLAAEAGVAPVTDQSGKRRGKYQGVFFRVACNKRLRRAATCLADQSRHASPWAADVYERARARGCDHQHATRILARSWLRVLWRCWQDRQPYVPEQHHAAKLFLEKMAKEQAA